MVSLAVLLSLVPIALVEACGDHAHSHAIKRSTSPAGVTAPTVPLVWGEVNFIHTTDSHGWLLGHQKTSPPEPNYS